MKEKLIKLWKYFTSKEMILYIVFGVLTTLINIASFWLLHDLCKWNLYLSNFLAWILSVAFAFLTNKIWVFESKSFAPRVLTHEIITFVGARVLSLGVDMGGMALLVDVLHANAMFSKIAVNVLVIIINYLLSKCVVFKKKN